MFKKEKRRKIMQIINEKINLIIKKKEIKENFYDNELERSELKSNSLRFKSSFTSFNEINETKNDSLRYDNNNEVNEVKNEVKSDDLRFYDMSESDRERSVSLYSNDSIESIFSPHPCRTIKDTITLTYNSFHSPSRLNNNIKNNENQEKNENITSSTSLKKTSIFSFKSPVSNLTISKSNSGSIPTTTTTISTPTRKSTEITSETTMIPPVSTPSITSLTSLTSLTSSTSTTHIKKELRSTNELHEFFEDSEADDEDDEEDDDDEEEESEGDDIQLNIIEINSDDNRSDIISISDSSNNSPRHWNSTTEDWEIVGMDENKESDWLLKDWMNEWNGVDGIMKEMKDKEDNLKEREWKNVSK